MANLVKSYFLPPEWRYKADGPIFLGSIISDPKVPQASLSERPVDVHQYLVIDDEQDNWNATIDARKQLEAGLHTSLLSIFGAGAGVSVNKGRTLTYKLKATLLQTQEIYPKPTFIENALQGPDVQKFLAQSKFRDDVYMIVGIMIGSGVSISSDESKDRGFNIDLTVSGHAIGIPQEIGPRFSRSTKQSTSGSFDATRKLVLGYRLQRISYVRKNKSFKTKEYKDGAVLGDNQEKAAENNEPYAEALGLADADIGADEFNMTPVSADTTGGNSFMFVIPQTKVTSDDSSEDD